MRLIQLPFFRSFFQHLVAGRIDIFSLAGSDQVNDICEFIMGNYRSEK